jgi:stage II sporulation protein R
MVVMVKRMLIFLGVMGCLVAFGRSVMADTSVHNSSETAFNIAVPHDAPIPKQALRLRIIANSDSAQDQEVKREVRDRVVLQVAKLLKGAKSEEEARQRVVRALPQIRETALEVTREHGYHYPVSADVGKVPFPTKVYGNQVYPAGTYEALRITLGSGQGQNWWCVLFPPLCFVDITEGDAVPNTGKFPDLPPLETIQVPGQDGTPKDVQVRLALVDYGEMAWKAVQRLWH